MNEVMAAFYEYLERNNLNHTKYTVTISGPSPDIYWLEASMANDRSLMSNLMGHVGKPVNLADIKISDIKLKLKPEGEGYTYRMGPMDYRS